MDNLEAKSRIKTAKNLEELLQILKSLGHNPGIYLRGSKWRAYVNVGSNTWEESEDPMKAFYKAIRKTYRGAV